VVLISSKPVSASSRFAFSTTQTLLRGSVHRLRGFGTQWTVLQHRLTKAGRPQHRDGGGGGLCRRCPTISINPDRHGLTFVAGEHPTLDNYRELKTHKFRKHEYDRRHLSFSTFPLMIPIRHWPTWYLQSYLLGVPKLILGNRSKSNSLTSIEAMSMEGLLATAMTHSRDFRPAFALGRIHNTLSALLRYCKAAHPHTGNFTCELHIRSGGNACILPVAPDHKAIGELASVWEVVRATGVPDEALVPQPLPPIVSEPHHLWQVTTVKPSVALAQSPESTIRFPSWEVIAPAQPRRFVAPARPPGLVAPTQPLEPTTRFILWVIFAPFVLGCAFHIFHDVY
jgi:hypothetical protein